MRSLSGMLFKICAFPGRYRGRRRLGWPGAEESEDDALQGDPRNRGSQSKAGIDLKLRLSNFQMISGSGL